MRVFVVGVNKFKSKKGNELCMLHYNSTVDRPGFTGMQASSCFVDSRLSFGIETLIGKSCDIYSSPGNSFIDVIIPVEAAGNEGE